MSIILGPNERFIRGFQKRYVITSEGEVWSTPKWKTGKGSERRALKLHKTRNNYICVNLCKKNLPGRLHSVHRLVADSFIPRVRGAVEVDHLDGNKYNNRKENLAWVTRAENIKRAWANGLFWHIGEKHHSSTLTDNDIRDIRALRLEGLTQQKIADKFHISREHVRDIIARKRWKHVP